MNELQPMGREVESFVDDGVRNHAGKILGLSSVGRLGVGFKARFGGTNTLPLAVCA